MIFKQKRHRSPKLLGSARGQICTLRVSAICLDGESVACHVGLRGSAIGGKVSDIFVAYGCNNCHAVIDGQMKSDLTPDELTIQKARANQETIQMMLDKGILKLP